MENERKYLLVGGKKLRLVDGQEEVGRSKNWILHRLPLSSCGRFQNYRLYLDANKARKNVWFLNTYATNQKIIKNRETEILEKYYPGMLDWFESARNGVIGVAPVTRDNGVEPPRKLEPVTPEVLNTVLDIIEEAWDDEWPLSIYGQSEPAGRYAPSVLATRLNMTKSRARLIVQSMIDMGAVSTVMFNSHTKMRGLKTARSEEIFGKQRADWERALNLGEGSSNG